MILCKISDALRYRGITPLLDKAIDWLMENQSAVFTKGTFYLESDDAEALRIRVNCEEPALIPREKATLEAHRKYIDIHVPLKGTETIGWAPVEGLKHIRTPYDEDKDVAFYGDTAHSLLHVKVGQIVVFFPEDAHAPNIGLGTHRKLCIKIPVL